MIQRILPSHTRIVRHGAHHHVVAACPEPTVRFGEPLICGLTQQRRQTLAVLGRRPGQAIFFNVSSSSHFCIGEHPAYVGKRVTSWLFTAHCQLSE